LSEVGHRALEFERAVRADLVRRRWMRWHAFLLGSVCFLACWAISTSLMHAGVEHLSVRWSVALLGGYAVFLALLWLWCRWLLSREEADAEEADADLSLDAIDLVPGRSGSPVPQTLSSSGEGGDMAGGGGQASLDAGEAVVDGADRAVKGILEAASSAEEGVVVVVPLAVVVGIAALIAGALSIAVFGLFSVEVLLGVAVEIAFASAGGALAFRAQREGWLAQAASRTWRPLGALVLVTVALGVLIEHWLPQAQSLPHAVQLLRSRR
jgi:hypothetical protein